MSIILVAHTGTVYIYIIRIMNNNNNNNNINNNNITLGKNMYKNMYSHHSLTNEFETTRIPDQKRTPLGNPDLVKFTGLPSASKCSPGPEIFPMGVMGCWAHPWVPWVPWVISPVPAKFTTGIQWGSSNHFVFWDFLVEEKARRQIWNNHSPWLLALEDLAGWDGRI